jgi:fructokinase
VTSTSQIRVAAPRVEVVDTIGAGDAFGAAILAWLHDRAKLHPDLTLVESELTEALRFACLVAAITCTRAGAETPWQAEVVNLLDSASPGDA